MKLSSRDAKAYLLSPDKATSAVLLYGPDPMRVALQRQSLCKALAGDGAEEEMRLSRIDAGELRKDAALLNDAITAQGFFPGPRVVVVDDARDTVAEAVKAALQTWAPGDAAIIVAAGQLTPRSALRKLFEGHPSARAIALYADPPSRAEIEADLKTAGLAQISPDALSALHDLARALDPGDFRQMLEKISLYKVGDAEALSAQEVMASAPATIEAGVDDALDIVAEGRIKELGPMLGRLSGQGVNPTQLCIGATRHFRRLHAAACDPRGPEAGIANLRPPVPYTRKEKLARQSRTWGVQRLEAALKLLTDTDLALRSARPVPQMAMVERGLIRVAVLISR